LSKVEVDKPTGNPTLKKVVRQVPVIDAPMILFKSNRQSKQTTDLLSDD